MREIIYLSAGKLRQFVPEPRRVPRAGAVRLSTPFGVGVDVEAQAADAEQELMRHLRQVRKHLEKTAAWYEEPDLRPGMWVQFEAPLRSVSLRGPYRDLVLFVDPAPRPRAGHPAGCRLLMPVSARHLRGWTPQLTDGPALNETGGGGDSSGAVFLTKAGHLVEALTTPTDPPEAPPLLLPPGLGDTGVRDLLHALDAAAPTLDASPPMTGYARVTAYAPGRADSPPCVVASPLMVEYAPETP